MDVFEKIKCTAREQSLTISELETRAGISNGSISKWGKSMPKADTLFKVAQVLNLPIEYFLNEAEIRKQIFLTSEENTMIAEFRKLDSTQKKEAIRYIRYIQTDDVDTSDTFDSNAFQHGLPSSSISESGKKNMVSSEEIA